MVHLKAYVVYVDPVWGLMWWHDGKSALHRFCKTAQSTIRAGKLIEITTITVPGGREFDWAKSSIRTLQEESFPKAVKATDQLLNSGAFEEAWVDMEGVVCLVRLGGGHTIIEMVVFGRLCEAILYGELPPMERPVEGSEVRLQGLLFKADQYSPPGFHSKIFLPGPRQIEQIQPNLDRFFTAPIASAVQLAGLRAGQIVHVSGEMVRQSPGREIVLRAGVRDLSVESPLWTLVRRGSMVEAVGRLERDAEGNLQLRQAFYRSFASSSAASELRLPKSTAAPGLSVLDRLEAVRLLSPTQAAAGIPVALRAIVTGNYTALGGPLVFLQDESAGIYLNPGTNVFAFQPGADIELTAITGAGEFAPVLREAKVVSIKPGRLPSAKRVTFDYLRTGAEDSQWVEVVGIVRSVVQTQSMTQMELTDGFSDLVVRLGVRDKPSHLMDATLRCRGAVGSVFDQHRQLLGVQLWCPGLNQIWVEEPPPGDLFALPLASMASLRTFRSEAAHMARVRLRGVVTAARSGRWTFLQEGDDAVAIVLRHDFQVHPGDVVDAVGIPAWDGSRLQMRDAQVQRSGTALLPAPVPARFSTRPEMTTELRRCVAEGRLISASRLRDEIVLTMKEKTTFEATCPDANTNRHLLFLPQGSLLRVTGVLQSVRGERGETEVHRLLANSANDVLVIYRGPWLTLSRALTCLGILAVMILASLVWVWSLQRQVREKTCEIRSILDSLPSEVCVLDATGRILSVNPAWREFAASAGLNPDDMEGENYLRICKNISGNGDDLARQVRARLREAPECQTEVQQLEYCWDKGASPRWFIVRITRFRVGEKVRVMVMHADITVLKRAEQTLREDAQAAALEAEASRVLAEAGSFNTLLLRCAEAVVRHLDAAGACIWILNPGRDRLELRTSTQGCPPLNDSNRFVAVVETTLGRIVRERQSILIGNLMDDATLFEPEWVRQQPQLSFVGQPILSGERVLGVVALFTRPPFSESVLCGLKRIAITLAVALERFAIEDKMRETQRLESLGVLAGGIAHDFNNLLTGIIGNAELAQLQVPPNSEASECLREVEDAANQAAELCRSMLAYAGTGRLFTDAIDLSELVQNMIPLVRHTMGEKAELRLGLAERLARVLVDTAQIRQVVMNLVTNAVEALSERVGVLTIRTGAMSADAADFQQALHAMDALPGDYVFLEVADNGCGMDPQLQSRIFEPFFTTKFTGRGLGLAAVWGIVRGHKGAILVSSKRGEGSTFRIMLPCAINTPRTDEAIDSASLSPLDTSTPAKKTAKPNLNGAEEP